MLPICRTSTLFSGVGGSAVEQLQRMLQIAHILGSPILRCVLGSNADRHTRDATAGAHPGNGRDLPGGAASCPGIGHHHCRREPCRGAAETGTQGSDRGVGSHPSRGMSGFSLCTGNHDDSAPRVLNRLEPEFWGAYPDIPAAEFARFIELVREGQPCLGRALTVARGEIPGGGHGRAGGPTAHRFGAQRTILPKRHCTMGKGYTEAVGALGA